MVELLNPIIRAGTLTIMDEEVSIAEQAEFIRSFPGRGIFHVAIEEGSGRVVGMQDVMPHPSGLRAFEHVGEISTFVAIDAQGRGIGTSLMEATIEVARKLGFTRISASIRADNPQALAFYQRQGFRIIGTAIRHAHVRGAYVNEVFAERLIDTDSPESGR